MTLILLIFFNFIFLVKPIFRRTFAPRFFNDLNMRTKVFESKDTNVKKFVFEWREEDGEYKGIAESVLYRYGEYKKRTVICCSVMSGCPVGCTFCGTGKFFVRNLTTDEICTQVDEVLKTIDCKTDEIEKTVGEIGEGGDTQHRGLCHAAGVPGNEHRSDGRRILRRTAQQPRLIALLLIYLFIYISIEDDGDELVAGGDIEEDACADGG